MKTDWNPVLRGEFDKPYWAELQQFVVTERQPGHRVPAADEVFAALHLTPYADVKVVILGQDPYHGPDQAHGLCFSVRPGCRRRRRCRTSSRRWRPTSACRRPSHGCLDCWARQGVLLLNASLTVRAGKAASHQGKGWETFTDEVLRAVNDKPERVVFILWGASARKKKALIDTSRHVIIESPHPSPLSASSGFFGSRPFSRANAALVEAGRDPIDWRRVPDEPAGLTGSYESGTGVSNVPCMCSVHVDMSAGRGRPSAASSLATGWSPSSRVTPSPPTSTCEPEPPCENGVAWGTPSIERVGGHRHLRHLVGAAPGQREPQDELVVHAQRARDRGVGVVERDVLDRLGEAPDRAPRLAGEVLVHRQPRDERARVLGCASGGGDEEREADLEVVAEVVVAVVDHGQHELASSGGGLDDLEALGDERLCGTRVDVEHRRARRRVAHDARHRDGRPSIS